MGRDGARLGQWNCCDFERIYGEVLEWDAQFDRGNTACFNEKLSKKSVVFRWEET
jgi:hypothetical protein